MAMSLKSLMFAVLSAASLAVVGTAGAAVMVLGSGPEKACYDAAKAESTAAKATQPCDQALLHGALTPRDRAATYTNRSVLYLIRSSARKALADTDMALAIDPTMTAASVNRSASLLLLDRNEEARDTVDRAMPFATGPELKLALYNRAMAHEALGDVKAAYRDLKRAIELDPAFEQAQQQIVRFTVRNASN
jgi:tetratricopeptide (TPR) repeat protein